jgi:glucokinase
VLRLLQKIMSSFSTSRFIVIGDVGGTNCRLELIALDDSGGRFERSGRGRLPAAFSARYRTTSASSVLALLKRFMEESGYQAIISEGRVELFSLSVCGPVINGVAILNNPSFGENGWRVDATYLSKELGGRVYIVNDFNAVGLSLFQLEDSDISVLYDGKGNKAPHDVKAWLGPGTGLGQAFAVHYASAVAEGKGEWRIFGSEGGISDFVVRTEDEWALKKYIAAQGPTGDARSFVDMEHVVSGTGITHIYKWLRLSHQASDEALDAEIAASEHPARLICEHGARPPSPAHDTLCCRAMDMFLAALGAEAANMALRLQAAGGVYIAGGIVSKIMPLITDGRVLEGYLGKGHSLLAYDNCPLYAVSKPGDDLGLTGAFINAMKHYCSG